MRKIIPLIAGLFYFNITFSQNIDSIIVSKIYSEALTSRNIYDNLQILCTRIGGRLSGSPQAASAIEWAKQVMHNLGFDTIYLQETKVPKWVRGDKEICKVSSALLGIKNLSVCALGRSIGTGAKGISGKIVEVHNKQELEKLSRKEVEGNIVFYNQAGDPSHFSTGQVYGETNWQRSNGAIEAAKLGAIGVIVRSLTLSIDDHPHTGNMNYDNKITRIPAIAVSTIGADILSSWLKKDNQLKIFFKTTCQNYPDTISYNVVGEIKGSLYPDEYITIGGHLDSWDLGQGAHDDGTGCVQSIEVLRIFKAIGIKPKRTLRAVMYMNEEISQTGGKKYYELAKLNKEKHYLAIETDAGGLLPLGFEIDAPKEIYDKIYSLKKYFLPYGVYKFQPGYGGVDIYPLKELNVPLIGLITNTQAYFTYHHSALDKIDNVIIRELQLGAASMAALVYLTDSIGLK